MPWTPDEEDFPISIPKNLQELEKLNQDQLRAMTRQEVDDRLQEIAEAAASSCRKEISGCTYETCVSVVSAVLNRAGSNIDNGVGEILVAESQSWAKVACGTVFLADS